MYTVYHGSWRDFGTAVGAFDRVFCSLRSHGTRDKARSMIDGGLSRTFVRGGVLFAPLTRHTLRLWALTRPSAQPTVPYQGKGKGRAITYEQLFICRVCSNKLTMANLCDRKKTPMWAR